jgi:hypothetical protein
MLRLRRFLGASLLGLAALAANPAAAHAAGAKVDWVRVEGPAGDDGARIGNSLKALLQKAAKKANFGKVKHVDLSARVVEYSAEEHGDVFRVSCTVMGRVVGGAGARSRISFGGSPAKRPELEKQVLTMVANGLVTRLAQIARTRALKEDDAAPPPVPGARARRRPPAALRR